MVVDKNLAKKNSKLRAKAEKIKLVLTDVDGVLTDTGVYYSEKGEELRRFSIRDGMGVERLRNLMEIETVIITGENSGNVKSRAAKLKITQLYLGSKNKKGLMAIICKKNQIEPENVAYIGDDINDYEIMKLAGLTATPADGMIFIKEFADFICEHKAGNGAFREFAELIIALKSEIN